ncbi:CG8292 [Drosophila busckii]|uniref:CG8292 n=1 Tax=Drosophila busckii TaxID=30019 RepID=A0A0M4E8A6_DROBS|nr:uncharacterized protein LOC108607543 [Drosophila busckii]ALC38201.1 CG8292 [Drosophila busckii]
MDVFGCFDYKRPKDARVQDMRTSTYRGHRYITDLRMGNFLQGSSECSNTGVYVRDPLMHEKQHTECSANYNWKYGDPDVLRNPSLNMKTQYVKPFDAKNLRFIKRKIKPMSSVSRDTYKFSEMPFEAELPSLHIPTPVLASTLEIDRSQVSYTKYLDPSATTYNLDYVNFTGKPMTSGIAAHDNLTYWNWDEHAPTVMRVTREADEHMCDESAARDCPKRRLEYQNMTKRVPHTGLITEVQHSYKDPKHNKEYMEFDTSDIKSLLTYEAIAPFATDTEYKILGSGEPVVKYV